jgi:hypothetical protein
VEERLDFSLTPGFSPVSTESEATSRFNGFRFVHEAV